VIAFVLGFIGSTNPDEKAPSSVYLYESAHVAIFTRYFGDESPRMLWAQALVSFLTRLVAM
jgi:hypothetical protein